MWARYPCRGSKGADLEGVQARSGGARHRESTSRESTPSTASCNKRRCEKRGNERERKRASERERESERASEREGERERASEREREILRVDRPQERRGSQKDKRLTSSKSYSRVGPCSLYRGTSLIRNHRMLGPYSRPMPRARGEGTRAITWSQAGRTSWQTPSRRDSLIRGSRLPDNPKMVKILSQEGRDPLVREGGPRGRPWSQAGRASWQRPPRRDSLIRGSRLPYDPKTVNFLS